MKKINYIAPSIIVAEDVELDTEVLQINNSKNMDDSDQLSKKRRSYDESFISNDFDDEDLLDE